MTAATTWDDWKSIDDFIPDSFPAVPPHSMTVHKQSIASYAKDIGKPLVVVNNGALFFVCPADTGGVLEDFKRPGDYVEALTRAGYAKHVINGAKQWIKQ
jgi:hypothetical protein